MKGLLLFQVLCLFTSLTVAELKVQMIPEGISHFVYEPVRVLVDLQGSDDAEIPVLPLGKGFSVVDIRKEVPADTAGIRFQLELIPEETGWLTLPSFTIEAGSERIQTTALRFLVSEPQRAPNMSLTIEFSKQKLLVDQPVEMTVTWRSQAPFTHFMALELEIPILRDARWEVYPLVPDVDESQRIGLPVNQQRAIAEQGTQEGKNFLTFRYQLVPRMEGTYSFPDAQMRFATYKNPYASNRYPSYFDNHFFHQPPSDKSFERSYFGAEIPSLTVRALPVEGRSSRYIGLVGSCKISTSIEPREAVVGQPLLLTVQLSDLQNGPMLRALPESVLRGLGSEFRITLEPYEKKISAHACSFTYIVRPLRSGISMVPALAIQIYDPESQSYKILRSSPLPIQILPNGTQMVYEPGPSEVPMLLKAQSGIRANPPPNTSIMNITDFLYFISRTAWIFWLLPPLAAWLLQPLFLRRDRCRQDPAFARAFRAERQFRKQPKDNEKAAWLIYLADRFNLNAEVITSGSITRVLESKGADADLIQDVKAVFMDQDLEKYGTKTVLHSQRPSLTALVRRLEKSLPLMILVLVLLPMALPAAPTPEALFEEAMALRQEKPDAAQPLFVEAALGFEEQNAYPNAGNAWFFSSKTGHALANYLAAERENPFDDTITESILFINNQRLERFQVEDGGVARLGNLWNRFGVWHPALRFALLTLLYTILWGYVLISRAYGRPFSRKIGIGFGWFGALIAISLLQTALQPDLAVVIQNTEARLGPGYAYEPAYQSPLHESITFDYLESRKGWVHARLPDGSESWIRESDCVRVP